MEPSLLVGKNTHRDLHSLLEDKRRLIISGTSNETAKALLVGSVFSFGKSPALIVTENENSVEGLAHWLHFFGVDVDVLHPVENAEGEIVPDSLQVFLRFMESGHKDVFLCSRDTWDDAFPVFTSLQDRKLTLKPTQKVDFTSFVEQLIELGYSH